MNRFEIQICAGLLLDNRNTNQNLLRIVGTIKMRVHFGHAKVALKLIDCEIMAAYIIKLISLNSR